MYVHIYIYMYISYENETLHIFWRLYNHLWIWHCCLSPHTQDHQNPVTLIVVYSGILDRSRTTTLLANNHNITILKDCYVRRATSMILWPRMFCSRAQSGTIKGLTKNANNPQQANTIQINKIHTKISDGSMESTFWSLEYGKLTHFCGS